MLLRALSTLLRSLPLRAGILCALIASAAFCYPLTWTLSGVTFDDGGTLSGTFVYDADTGILSSWNLVATQGSSLAAFTWNSSDSSGGYINGCASQGPCLDFSSNQTFPDGDFNENRILNLIFLAPLTDNGGTVSLYSNTSDTEGDSHECLDCAPFRLVSGGAVSAPVPQTITFDAAGSGTLLTYETTCDQAAPCFQAPGITGSNLTRTISGNGSGYDPNDVWSVADADSPGDTQFYLTMTTSAIVTIGSLNFTEFNNDCENYGVPVVNCPIMTWAVMESVNGGAFQQIYTFSSGLPYQNYAFSVPVAQTFAPGETITFEIVNTSAPDVFTAQFVFSNISLRPPEHYTLGASPFLIAAQSSSLLPVTIASTTTSVCKTASDLVRILSTGTCTIQASQSGNANFQPATTVTRSFTVSQANPSGTLSQAAGSPVGVGSTPVSMAAGDFNGDGIPDLVTANQTGNSVTVLLGNGSGGFTQPSGSPFAAGSAPRAVAVGDFNGDGYQDLAITDVGNNKITVLLGNGAGGFAAAPGSPFSVGSSPVSIVVWDFNGDGIQDLATANDGDNNVTVLVGNGSGGFSQPSGSPFAAGNSPAYLVAGDFDGNGIQDLAIANFGGNNVTVLLGNGSGGFTTPTGSPFAAGSGPYYLAVGDFKGNGIQDLAVADLGGNNVTVLLGNGSGGFSAATGSPFGAGTSPESVAVGDFNGDGILDIAAGNAFGNNVTLLLGNGSGGFSAAAGSPFGVGNEPFGVVAGDFNGDGLTDLAAVNGGDSTVTILLGTPTATTSVLSTTSPLTIGLGQSVPLTLTVSDSGNAFNAPTGTATFKDGSTALGTASQNASPYTFNASSLALGTHDLVGVYGGGSGSTGSGSNTITIDVLPAQTITFAQPNNTAFSSGPLTLTATSSSNLTVMYGSNTTSVCTVTATGTVNFVSLGSCSITASQPGNGSFGPATPVTRAFNITIGSQTITFDATPNKLFGVSPFPIAAQSSALLPVTIASTTSSVCTTAGNVVALLSTGTCIIQANQSGNSDYNAANTAMQSFNVSQATSSGTLTAATNSPFSMASGSSPYVVAVGDFNGDGKPDLAVANVTTAGGNVTILMGDGMGNFTATGSPITLGAPPQSLVVGDFNGDGKLDLAVANSTAAGSVTILLGNGSGNFSQPTGSPFGVGANPTSIAVADFNGDGIQDLAVANGGSGNITLLLGNGSGGFAASAVGPFMAGTSPDAIAVGDFNGDGKPDLAVANSGSGNVTLLLGNGSGGFNSDTSQGSPFTVGTGPSSIAVGDFNGDGKLDLAVSSASGVSGNSVTVLLGNGSGGFTSDATQGSPFPVGSTPNSVVVGDFNGDGFPDLATANEESGNVTVLLGNGAGGFAAAAGSPFTAGTNPVSIAVADFNRDGIEDLATANVNSGTANTGNVTVLLGGLSATNSTLSTTSPLTIMLGQTVPLTLTVSDTGTAFNTLTGTATFMDGSNVLGTATQTGSPYTFTATGLTVGSHMLTGVYGGGSGSAGSSSNTLTIQVNLDAQTITFGPLSNVAYGTGPVVLTATASSTLPVMYASNSMSVCTVSGSNVNLLSVGNCSITASQMGNTTFAPASTVTQAFMVTVGSQTIAFDAIPNQIYGISPFGIAAEASSLLPVTLTSTTTSVCKIAGNLVMLLSAGNCSITASQGGTSNVNPAASVMRSFTVSRANPSSTFSASAGSPITVGTNPVSIAEGDFNGDGKRDFAIANKTDGTVSVFLGAGSGGFNAASGSPFTAGPGIAALVVGDFNGDGFQDLAMTSSGEVNTLIVLLGNGMGMFAPTSGTPSILGTTPASMVVADFNGDGIQDLAVANQGGTNVTLLLGNGAGGFTAPASSPFTVGAAPASLATADFNGDGFPDLAIANSGGGTVTVLLGNGAGGFTADTSMGSPFQVGTTPDAVAVGDFNGDGVPDLVIANSGDGTVTVLIGNGSGGFSAVSGSPFSVGSLPDAVAVGDFNGDGYQDLAIANSVSGNVTMLLGNGSGGFTPASGSPFTVGTSPASLVVGDFTGDGAENLATANSGSNNVTVLLGTPPALSITTSGLPVGLLNLAYGPVTMAAIGAFGDYSWSASGAPPGVTITPAGVVAGTPTATGLFSMTVTVSDSVAGIHASTTYSVTVYSPVSISTAMLPNGSQGQPYGPVTMAAAGGAGNYSWSATGTPSGVTMSTAGVLSGTPTASGLFSINAAVSDATTGLSASNTYVISVFSPLTVTTTSIPNGYVGAPYGPVTVTATGGTGNYSWSVSGAPPGVSISAAGVLSSNGAVFAAAAAGPYTVRATVTDLTTNLNASASFSITVAPPLSVTTSALPNGSAGATYGPVTLAATGGSGNYSWTVTGAPAGVTMTPAGVLTSNSVLTSAAAGSYPAVTVTVTDTTTTFTASHSYPVSIAFAPLTLGGSTSLGGFVPGAAISGSFPATGGEPPYTWSAPQGLPTGLTLNTSTGAVTGSITPPGNYTFQIQVVDSQTVSASTSVNVSLFVLGIATTSLPSGSLNVAYTQNLGAVGGVPPYSWSVTAGALPAGLSLATSGVLTGTPTSTGTLPAGGVTSSFTVSLTSGSVTVSAPLTLTITPQALPLKIPGGGGATPVTLTGGTVSIPYSQTLQAINGKPPYAWSVIGGNLPNGLSLNGSGTLSGTPTLAGTFAFTGQVTDSAGAMVSAAFTVTIAPPALTITTGSQLPNGIVGSGYPAQILSATGGMAPYTFQASAGLPDGLALANGQLSGIPAANGVFTFTVTVSDSTLPMPLTATASFQVSIEPAHADLILSQTSFGFNLNAGAAGLPSGASITVQSSVVLQLLNYSVAVMPTAPWLDVTGGGTTPGAIGINLDPSALNLPSGINQTSIVVTCITPSPCAGNSQTISVTLIVTAAPPQLTVTTDLLSFSAQTSSTQTLSQTMGVENTGGGVITVNSITAADAFVTVSNVPATIPAGPAIPVTVTVDPTGLAAGYYQSTILVNTSAGSANIPVTLLLAQNATMTLNPAGTQFQMPAGGAPGNPGGSFLVSVTGTSTVNWTATLLSGANWLTLSTASGSSVSASPGTVSFTINANAATLAPQAYYATIQITSNGVVDSPQNFLVVLNVEPAANVAQPDPEPAGLVFISSAPGTLPPQTVQVFASSPTALTYQASSDSSWLLVSPSSSSTSAAAPDSSSVSVSLSGLAAGVYRGNVSYAFSSAAVRSVNVTLIIEAPAANSSDRTSISALPKASCVPSQLVPTQTGLVNNFAQPTSWPTPLTVLLVDDCGNAVNGAQVVTTFNNGDPPLALNPASSASGTYSGTWTPRNTSGQVTIAARATAGGFPAATAQITGQVTPNAAPLLNTGGTLNVFAPVVGAPVAPGTIVQIYGSNLASQAAPATTIPLPTSLNQTSVLIGGLLAPLYYISPGQINAQVPFELAAGQTYQVIVSANGALSTPNPIQLTPAAPGIAQFPAGEIIAQHLDGSLILETSPAAPGEYIVFYVAGMGLTNQTVPSGTASPSTNLAVPLDTPTLTLNGAPVTNILFAGLTPTLVGLYQVNFQVPANAPNGDLQLVLTQTNGLSDSTILPVQSPPAQSSQN